MAAWSTAAITYVFVNLPLALRRGAGSAPPDRVVTELTYVAIGLELTVDQANGLDA